MKSVYIHIPFCRKICYYCDFCKFFYNKKWVLDYLKALEKEIKESYKNEVINTIYIGGGTPSCLSIGELKILFSIIKIFNTSKLSEFTIECNVEDISEEKLKLFAENSVTRLSIGVQSFNKDILKSIGRNYEINIFEKISLAKTYFDNISIDLIYGYFDETVEKVKEDIESILKLNINHISTYSLMIENNTRFYKKEPINEDLDYKMYEFINSKLLENDFKQYEISNYAKNGYESKHNLVYWNNQEYYGFGLGASSYLNNFRITNTRNFTAYLNGKTIKEKEKLNKEDKIKYELILGFRKINGINKKGFYNKYNIDIKELFNIKDLLNNGYLIDEGGNIFISKKYLYVQNQILINFI